MKNFRFDPCGESRERFEEMVSANQDGSDPDDPIRQNEVAERLMAAAARLKAGQRL